jgi:hypothetical protein
MKRPKSFLSVTVLGCCLLVLASWVADPSAATQAAPRAHSVVQWVIGGGGGRAEAGSRTLEGTIGQPVVGGIGHEPYELGAGFWGGIGTVRRIAGRCYLPVIVRAH